MADRSERVGRPPSGLAGDGGPRSPAPIPTGAPGSRFWIFCRAKTAGLQAFERCHEDGRALPVRPPERYDPDAFLSRDPLGVARDAVPRPESAHHDAPGVARRDECCRTAYEVQIELERAAAPAAPMRPPLHVTTVAPGPKRRDREGRAGGLRFA
jgi:hypothetical protein